jgi:hypothetical protein
VTGLRQTGVRWNPALYADLEAGSGAEMLVMQNGALRLAILDAIDPTLVSFL